MLELDWLSEELGSSGSLTDLDDNGGQKLTYVEAIRTKEIKKEDLNMNHLCYLI